MKNFMFCTINILLLLILLASAAICADYVLFDLGLAGESESQARAVNNVGQIVGWSSLDGHRCRACIWERGSRRYIDDPRGYQTIANGINDLGWVVGYSYWSEPSGWPSERREAFIWRDGVFIPLGSLAAWTDSVALSINNRGQVVGQSRLTEFVRERAFLWQDGQMTNLGSLAPGAPSIAYDINDNSDIVGSASYFTGGESHAVVWKDSNILSLPGKNRRNAVSINDVGQVAGGYWPAFVWQDGVFHDLEEVMDGKPGHTQARWINNRSQVVGTFLSSQSSRIHAFLWEDGVMQNLGWLGSGYESVARGINDAGWVVGQARDGDWKTHAVVWRPVTRVYIDIKPGDPANTINLKSRGSVRVAVISTYTFDAATIDPPTVKFAGTGPVKWILGDVNSDSIPDLVLFFDTQTLILEEGTTDATLTGAIAGELNYIAGTDNLRVVQNKSSNPGK